MISIEFLVTSLVVVLIPGTGVLYTVASGLFMSWRAAIAAAIGCTIGIVPSLLASVFGLALIFHTSALAFQIIKYAGVIYLLYLAWSMWRSSGALQLGEKKAEQHSMASVAIRGCLINILNPKLSIFFLAFLPQFLTQQADQPVEQMIALGGIFMLMTLLVFILYGILANSVREYIIHSEKISGMIQKVFAGSFAALGLKLALTEKA